MDNMNKQNKHVSISVIVVKHAELKKQNPVGLINCVLEQLNEPSNNWSVVM